MSINERVHIIINDLFDGNKRAFARQIDIAATVVENIVGKRQGKPSFDVIEKICANANISAEWLVLGNGSMKKNEIDDLLMTTHDNPIVNLLLDRIEKLAFENARLNVQLENMKKQKKYLSNVPQDIAAEPPTDKKYTEK